MAEQEKLSKKEILANSTEMSPVQGTIDLDIPADVLWEAFRHADWWARWNKCFYWARNRDLVVGEKLIWCFQPIRWWYLYKMPAIANIVEVEKEKKVTWEVTALPGFYARHTYHIEDLGDGRSRFGSWEQAMGAQIRFSLTKKFWTAHFTFVKDRSLEGARQLEKIYLRDGKISKNALPTKSYLPLWLLLILLLLLLVAGSLTGWFYASYLRPQHVELMPGVYVATAGGGNSLIVKSENDLLVADTKFPPASDWLKNWIAANVGAPVTAVVNTHYHYDHTQGNTNYPEAKIYAYKIVPELMRKRDADWWSQHSGGVPNNAVEQTETLKIGSQEILLTYPGHPAHTEGDLWLYLRRGDVEIAAVGDLFFNTYYPFMDLGDGGINIRGIIAADRAIAAQYLNAKIVPGHGPIASAADLTRYADYLEFLDNAVSEARKNGLSEDAAVSAIDLSKWNLSRLPSYHGGKLCWATAEMNIRWVYQLQTGNTHPPREDCTF